MPHGEEVECAECAISCSNVGKRDPFVAGRQDIIRTERYGRVRTGGDQARRGCREQYQECGSSTHEVLKLECQGGCTFHRIAGTSIHARAKPAVMVGCRSAGSQNPRKWRSVSSNV